MRTLIIAALLAGVLGKRSEDAAQKLAGAKAAYEAALAKTGDFECVSPEFDAVLKMFDKVPAATKSKAEAKDLAKRIREKRAAAAVHARALDAAPVPVAASVSDGAETAPVAVDPQKCKVAKRRMIGLARARKRAGKPPLGTMAFSNAGEVAFAAGAEPSVEEAALMETLKECK
jgi:hypothetical protein